MFRPILLFSCIVLFWFGQTPVAKDWRGLIPLKSTRMDVERVLGPPDVNNQSQHLVYYLTNEVVDFFFSDNPQCENRVPYSSWDVPKDTVTSIRVGLKRQITVREAGVDLTTIEKRKGDYDLPNHFYYKDTETGFSYEVGGEYLMAYWYGPGRKSENLRCQPIK